MTLKIQVKIMSEVKVESHNVSLTSHRLIPLVPCQSALPFLSYSIFKIWPWKSKVKVIAQCHKVTPYRLKISLLFHVDQPSHSWDKAISNFDVENSRSRSWSWVKVKVESHNMGPTFSRLTSLSFHVDWHPIPELRPFQNLTFKIKDQGHGWCHSSRSQYGSNTLLTHIPWVPFNRHSHSWDTAFLKFDPENPGSRSNDHHIAQLEV